MLQVNNRVFRARLIERGLFKLIIVIALAGATRTSAEEPNSKEYAIHLSAPMKLTDKWDIAFSAKRVTHIVEIAADGQSIQPSLDTLAVQFEGTLEGLAVDSKGQFTKFRCSIKKFVRTDGRNPADILPPGAVVTVDATGTDPAAKKGETLYTMANAPLTAEQVDALQLALDAPPPENPTDEEVYGSPPKRKVGDTWPMNLEKAKQSATMTGWSTTPQHCKGTTTLVGVASVKGTEWATVRLNLSCDKFEGAPQPGQTISTCTWEEKLVETFPIDNPMTGAIIRDTVYDCTTKETPAQGGAQVTVKTTTKTHIEYGATPAVQGK